MCVGGALFGGEDWRSREIVGCSIAFRRFGLLLQNKYATSLIRTMSLFLGCEEDKSPEVE